METITGNNANTVLRIGTPIEPRLKDKESRRKKICHVKLAATEDGARSGGNAIARGGAMTGKNSTTGVGLAAMVDTLENATVAGNFVKATKKTEIDQKSVIQGRCESPLGT